MSESKTPLTDERADNADGVAEHAGPNYQVVSADFARKLERDRADLLAACRLALRVFQAATDRGYYPLELVAGNEACITPGWQFLTDAIEKAVQS